MIKVVQGFDRGNEGDLFDAMYRQRKAIFADRKGWDVAVVDGVFEIDEFDRDDTVYICCLSPGGALEGSMRLLNTTLDHMAATTFASMFPGLVVRSPTIWEVTRFAVPACHDLQPNGISRPTCELLLGMARFGLEAGVSQMTAIYEAGFSRIYRRCGLRQIILGRHRTKAHGTVEFGLCDISRQLVHSIQNATGLRDETERAVA